MIRRLVRLLRKGPRGPRVQALLGLVLCVGAAFWFVSNVLSLLWPILGAAAVATVGIFLVRRAVREPGASS